MSDDRELPDEMEALFAEEAAKAKPVRAANGAAEDMLPTNRPTITIREGNIADVVEQAEDALIAGGSHYQRGKHIVYIGETPVINNRRRERAGQRIYDVGDFALVNDLNRVARFEKFDGRSKKLVSVDPPKSVAQTLIQMHGRWRLPVLSAVLDLPTIASDGRLITQPGYDAETGLFLDFKEGDFPDIPDRPTKDDARDALKILLGLVPEFPFVTNADRSVFLSCSLTTVSRTAFQAAPGFAFTATAPRTGKSKLVDTVHMIANGKPASVITASSNAEEFEKRLDTALLAGVPNIAIDNVSMPVESNCLCTALTQPTVVIRPFGRLKDTEVPSISVITLTGNNLVLVGDLNDRVLRCALDAKCERPGSRKFTSVDPVIQIRENRSKFVMACLTILRAFIISTEKGAAPDIPEEFGGFEEWSNWVRAALIWLGQADPCATMKATRDSDPTLVALQSVILQWENVIGLDAATTVAELIRKASECSEGESIYLEFLSALRGAANSPGTGIDNTRLGKWLSSVEGRVLGHGDGARKLEKCGMQTGVALWRLTRLQASDAQDLRCVTSPPVFDDVPF